MKPLKSMRWPKKWKTWKHLHCRRPNTGSNLHVWQHIDTELSHQNTKRTFLHVLLQMVDADAENIHQIYSLSAHVWKSLEDDLHVYSLSKLINPSLPINLLVPLPVWRQMCRTESDLLRSRPDVERVQDDSQQQPLTFTGRWLHIDFHGGIHYKTDGVIFLTKLCYASHKYINMFLHNYRQQGASARMYQSVLGYHCEPRWSEQHRSSH